MLALLKRIFILSVVISAVIHVFKLIFSAYTAPRTWVVGELVTAAIMNQYIRDNQEALKDPPTDIYNVNEVSNYTTTSTSFVDVDATNLSLTITTTGGDILVWFFGSIVHDNTQASGVHLDIDVDGSRQGGDDGIIKAAPITGSPGITFPIGMVYLVQGLTAGAHTIKLQWKVSAASGTTTATMYAGAGTTRADIHPQFGAREVS